ncbi:urease accessory protein UreD [Polynucleobacter rarus]|uniref:urease accessory protein UreD n=1 Tax=Polynucleobacter rarus TaxID=556055 RepID=UPI000D3E1EA5|nr:urease accessory protein UreD [Polynucleobacter rarus]
MENMLDSESTQLAWHAKLRLDFSFSSEKNKTLLSHKEHSGPLLVQKSLYPEGDAICHAVILHPPAGIAGGDHLVIDLNIENDAKAVITTPGATKWYKANKKEASQKISIKIEADSHLDFLPQENIFFNSSNAHNQIIISQDKTSSCIGWDIAQLGRTAQGESWENATLRNDIEYYFNEELCWVESTLLESKHDFYNGSCGLDGFPVFGTMWLSSPSASEELLEEIAELLSWDDTLRVGVTRIQIDEQCGLILVRGLSDEVEYLRNCFIQIWLYARERITGIQASPLRIWKT